MKTCKTLLFILHFLIAVFCFSQTGEIDSLKNILKTSQEDTQKIKTLIYLGDILWQTGYNDSALKYAETTISLSQKLKFNKGLCKGYSIRGIAYYALGNYPEALKNHFTALKLREKMNDKQGIAASLTNIGNIYFYQGNLVEALNKYTEAFGIMKSINNKKGIAASYNNIGMIFSAKKQFNKAIENYSLSLTIKDEMHDELGKATCYNNIGSLYGEMGDLQKSLKNHFDALKIREKIGDRGGEASSLGNIATAYYRLKNYSESEKFTIRSITVSKEIGDMEGIKEGNRALYGINNDLGNYAKALVYYKLFISYKDSLLNEENTKKSVRLEMNYEFDKKEASTKLEQEKKEAVSAAESRKQKVIIWSVCGILLLVFCFAIFAYRSYLQKQKANVEITKQKEIIEEKQKEILDSIYYARRIQRSLLPSEKYIDKNLNRLLKLK